MFFSSAEQIAVEYDFPCFVVSAHCGCVDVLLMFIGLFPTVTALSLGVCHAPNTLVSSNRRPANILYIMTQNFSNVLIKARCICI